MANRLTPYSNVQKNRSGRAVSEINWDNSDDVVGFVEDRWNDRDRFRQTFERQWYINIAQYLGLQYHSYNDLAGKLYLPKAPAWRVRLVCNRLMPIVRKIVSKILRQRPIWTVLPATGEVEDQIRAIVGTKILQYYWRWLDMDQLLVDSLTWLGTTGNVFLQCVWDSTKGAEIAIEPQEMAMLPPALQRFAKQGVNLGDVAVSLVTPFEIDPDPDCTQFTEATHAMQSKATDVEWIKDRYNVTIEPDYSGEDVLGRYYEKKLATIAGPSIFGGVKANAEESNKTLLHSLWVNPTKRYQHGRLAVVAGGKLLQVGDLPNSYYRIPFIHLREIPVPGRFWGTCALEQCIPLQAEYNRGRSSWVECRNLMSKPKWLVPRGSGIQATALTSEPGEVVEYTPGFKPEAWSPPPMPDYVRQLLEYALKDIEDSSAQHEVTNARAPSRVRSGVAIATLQEQDDTMLAPLFMTFEKTLSKIGSWILQLVAQNVTERRLVKIVGKDHEIDTLVFKGKDLIGTHQEPGINYFDVETQMGSQLPMSRASRVQYLIDLVREGILDKVQDKRKILQMLELGTEEPFINDANLDRQEARRENGQMLQGIMIEPQPWNDDLIHAEEHRRFQKNPNFQEQASMVPGALEIFEQHIQGHMLRLQGVAPPPESQAPTMQSMVQPGAGAPILPMQQMLQQQPPEAPSAYSQPAG